MAPLDASAPTTLIPARRQALWGWPAVVNFALGGLGTGFYVAATLAAGPGSSPVSRLAAWLGPALVLAGFAAVATEAGRPLRGPRVLARARTSWMSRELWLGGAFALLAGAGLVLDLVALRAAAMLAATVLAWAQGAILRDARGVTAWAVPVMPALFLTSTWASGAGLLVLVRVGLEGDPGARLLGGALVTVTLNAVVSWAFVTWSREPAFIEAVRPLREGRGALAMAGGACVVPSLLLAAAIALPALAAPLAAVGAAALVASQVQLKAALILEAGHLRPITLPGLGLERRSR